MDKVKSASGNFPDNMVPDKILMFYQFLDDNKSSLDFLSYETITDCKKYLEPLLNDNFLSEIYTFYVDDSHSAILYGTGINLSIPVASLSFTIIPKAFMPFVPGTWMNFST